MKERKIELLVDHSCNEKNRSMQLVFDLLTPRPHLIILQREELRKPSASDQEMRDLIELVHDFLLHKPEYDNNAVLSFHRGVWYQRNHDYFHAHLCVSKKPYCKDIETMIEKDGRLSAVRYLNQLYAHCLASKIQYTRYRNRCLSKAYLCYDDPIASRVPLQQFHTSKFTLVYLAATPRIGIVAKNTQVDLWILYSFVNNFYFTARKKLSSLNPSYENFGAHLCLYVRGKNPTHSQLTPRSDRVLVSESNPIKTVRLVGYIQMDEQLYLRWLPVPFQSIWLEQFGASQHFVST